MNPMTATAVQEATLSHSRTPCSELSLPAPLDSPYGELRTDAARRRHGTLTVDPATPSDHPSTGVVRGGHDAP
eukprot:7261024-Lingulodinium_polyedra.AAC.1